jgi:hypothetical protein
VSARRDLRVIAALVALLAARPAAAASTNAFERPAGGPRSAALGGHSVVLLDDDYAMGANPGRLVFAERSVSAQYDRVDPDVDLWRGRLGLALPLGQEITEPLQTSRAYRRALGAAFDVTGLTLIEGSGYREATASLGFAVAPTSFLGFGVSGSYERASSDLDAIAAHAWGVDLGGSMDLSDHWAVAFAIRNAFGRATFDGAEDEDRSAEVTIGLATRARRRWQAELDYAFQHNTTSAVSGGVEIHVVPGVFDLRGGMARELLGGTRVVPSAGAGFTIQHLKLDYAFRSDQDGSMDAQHQLALGARF